MRKAFITGLLLASPSAFAGGDMGAMGMHGNDVHSYFSFDRLEYQKADAGTALAWEFEGWVGGDVDRLWLRSEGERTNGLTEEAELQALYGHAISPWWDVVAGVRQDFKPESPQTWGALGLQGQPLDGLDTKATFYFGEQGNRSLRLEAEYDLNITQNLILQPMLEANLFSRNDALRETGSGLSNLETGLRLRYEIIPEVAPYIGVYWNKQYGRTLDYAREEGEDAEEGRLVVGVKLWW